MSDVAATSASAALPAVDLLDAVIVDGKLHEPGPKRRARVAMPGIVVVQVVEEGVVGVGLRRPAPALQAPGP